MGNEFFSLLVYGQRLGRDPRCSAYLGLCSPFCLPFEFHSHSQGGTQQQFSPMQPEPASTSLPSQLFLKPAPTMSKHSYNCSPARREVLVNSFLSSMGAKFHFSDLFPVFSYTCNILACHVAISLCLTWPVQIYFLFSVIRISSALFPNLQIFLPSTKGRQHLQCGPHPLEASFSHTVHLLLHLPVRCPLPVSTSQVPSPLQTAKGIRVINTSALTEEL